MNMGGGERGIWFETNCILRLSICPTLDLVDFVPIKSASHCSCKEIQWKKTDGKH